MYTRTCRSTFSCQVREELERLLDDDLDMAAMHLSEKLAYQAAGHSSRRDIEDEASASDEERYRMPITQQKKRKKKLASSV